MVIKGIKTNVAFMLNVLNHPTFAAGMCDTGFIANTPDLLNIEKVEDNELKVIEFLGNKFVNETKGHKPQFNVPVFPKFKKEELSGLRGIKQLLDENGPKAVADWVKEQQKLLINRYYYARRSAVPHGYKSENRRYGEDRSGSIGLRKGSFFGRDVGRSNFRYVVPFPQRIAVGKTGNSQGEDA